MGSDPSAPRLVVRADSRPGIGAGHAMRQSALVERWTSTGGSALVVVDAPSPWLVRRIEGAGGEVVVASHGAGPGTADLVSRIRDQGADWVVLDGYEFGSRVQEQVAAAGVPVAVVDDHGQLGRRHDYAASVVVDPNLGPRLPAHERRPPGSALLHGPRFTLLRDEFRQSDEDQGAIADRIVVLAGGEWPDAGEVLADRLAQAVARRHPDVVVTTPARAGQRDQLAALLRSARVAVSAAGSTSWELAHLGVPMVLHATADNQVPVGEALSRAGAAWYVGLTEGADGDDQLVDAALTLLEDEDARAGLGAAAAALVDGHGPARVSTELRSTLVPLRDATPADARTLWAWANDPVVRSSSFSPEPIPWDDHRTWFADLLGDPHRHVYIAGGPNGDWGQIRFDVHDGVADIGVSVASASRGRYLAPALIRAGVRRQLAQTDVGTVRALVKVGNLASQASFRAADFEVEPTASPEGQMGLLYDRGRDGRD